MLDKIVKLNNNDAYMIYEDGRVVTLHSNTNVNSLILTMLLPYSYEESFESYCRSLEDTI